MADDREEIARLLADFNDYVRGEKINRVHIIRAAAVMSSRIKAILARAQGPGPGEAVGEAGEMPGSNGGFTMAVFKASDVPVGTKLYAATPTRESAHPQKGGEG